MKPTLCVKWFATLTAASLTSASLAQNYPVRPIQMIVPLQAASAGDIAIRVVAQKLTENLKQQIVVENQAGAGGLIGSQRFIRMAPDGYALAGVGDNVLNYAVLLTAKPGFDPVNDFAPVSLVSVVPWVLVSHPSFPAKDVRGFVAVAKAQPGKIDYSSAGTGTAQQVAMELFQRATGIRVHHVPYRGASQAVLDVVGGQVTVTFAATAIPLPFIKNGRLRALAVPSEKRASALPDVPTLTEAGVPGFFFDTWIGIFAPRGTPRPIIDRLNSEIATVLGDAAVRERLAGLALEARGSTPEELGRRTRDGLARVGKVAQDAGIKLE